MYLPISRAEEEGWFGAQLADDSRRIFAIETEEGLHLGNVGLHSLDWTNRKAELGIVIAEKEYWGRGYGTDAVPSVLDFAFNAMNLHCTHLSVLEFNRRAIRCYEKGVFHQEGREREAFFRDGRYHDSLLMAVLRERFVNKALREE